MFRWKVQIFFIGKAKKSTWFLWRKDARRKVLEMNCCDGVTRVKSVDITTVVLNICPGAWSNLTKLVWKLISQFLTKKRYTCSATGNIVDSVKICLVPVLGSRYLCSVDIKSIYISFACNVTIVKLYQIHRLVISRMLNCSPPHVLPSYQGKCRREETAWPTRVLAISLEVHQDHLEGLGVRGCHPHQRSH